MADFNFNLKKTEIYRAVRLERSFVFKHSNFLNKFFSALSGLSLLVLIYGLLTGSMSAFLLSKVLGFFVWFLIFSILSGILEKFFYVKIRHPKLKTSLKQAIDAPGQYNLAKFFDLDSARIVRRAIQISRKKGFPEINSSVLFLSLLEASKWLGFVFSRLLLNTNELKEVVGFDLKRMETGKYAGVYSDDFRQVVIEAMKIAEAERRQRVGSGDLLLALSKIEPNLARILIDNRLKTEDIENLVLFKEYLEERIERNKKWWEYNNLLKFGSFGKEWSSGYTITLDNYSVDLTDLVRKSGYPEIFGHQKEIGAMENILSRTDKNNVLLIGEPGVGKKAIVQGFAARSALGVSLPDVNYKRTVILDLSTLLAQLGTTEEVEMTLDRIFKEVIAAGNVILTINDFHDYVENTTRPGVVDISGILAPHMQSPNFKVVALTTFSGLHKTIEQRPALLSLFEKVEVAEISEKETIMYLQEEALALEQKYKKFVSYPALRDVVSLSGRYIANTPFPKKAVDVLNELMIRMTATKESVALPRDVAKILTEKTGIPVGDVEKKERQTLLGLEDLIHQRIINQEEAVKEVSSALRRARSEVSARKGPMGTFLFLGPTGVGKTETAKALAAIYFGSEEKMIRIDMSEFQDTKDIPRLIGSPGEEGMLTTKVQEAPFSLILLDEIEKAHLNVLNLFLQVLDDGRLTDGLGRRVDFRNCIIVATSNAGYKIILEALKTKTEWLSVKQKMLDEFFEKGTFKPEFINRFDAVVIFKPLTKENLLAIAELSLQKLRKNLKDKGIDFSTTIELKEKIVELSYDPTFGAREMKRVIQDRVENVLASALLSDQIKRGDSVEMDPSDFKLKVKKR